VAGRVPGGGGRGGGGGRHWHAEHKCVRGTLLCLIRRVQSSRVLPGAAAASELQQVMAQLSPSPRGSSAWRGAAVGASGSPTPQPAPSCPQRTARASSVAACGFVRLRPLRAQRDGTARWDGAWLPGWISRAKILLKSALTCWERQD